MNLVRVFEAPRFDNFVYCRIRQDGNCPHRQKLFFRHNDGSLHTVRITNFELSKLRVNFGLIEYLTNEGATSLPYSWWGAAGNVKFR